MSAITRMIPSMPPPMYMSISVWKSEAIVDHGENHLSARHRTSPAQDRLASIAREQARQGSQSLTALFRAWCASEQTAMDLSM